MYREISREISIIDGPTQLAPFVSELWKAPYFNATHCFLK